MSERIVHIDSDRFEEVVLRAEQPVVVDFYSTECPPCEALAAKFEPLSEAWGADVRFVKIFRQGNRELAQKLGVASSPTLIFYRDGQPVGDRLTGGIKRADIERNLSALVPAERAAAIAAGIPRKETDVDILILGGGPAGLTAGIYSAQAHFKTLLVDRGLAGGNVAITHQVSNWPGFTEPVPGWKLAHDMSAHAWATGVDAREAVDLTRVDLEKREVVIDGLETIHAKKIVLATGSSPRMIGIKGEREYRGRGVSYCATCDAKYYQDKHVVVIGGGNSAIEESLFIAKFASRITIVHQFDKLQANKAAQEKAFAEPKIKFLFRHEPREFVAVGNTVGAVVVEDLATGDRRRIACDGVFIFAGMTPNLEGFEGAFVLDEWGYVKVDEQMRTSLANVFAAGDVRSKPFRQMTTAVSDGTIAAMAIARDLGT